VVVLSDLDRQLAGEPVRFTGLTPLLKSAQIEIFNGFWQSFTAACLTISGVMIVSLRSLLAGLVAMVPNIIPIWMVFGSMGYFGTPVDIGMMMTGSIALGISVDCTFHFLVHYREAYRSGCPSAEACRRALIHSGEPMLESTVICSVGMLALCLSSFVPTARFGGMMAAQMMASVLGELVVLPALLCCRPARREPAQEAVLQHPGAVEASDAREHAA
jgi:predicted RND superfamily exporter protein